MKKLLIRLAVFSFPVLIYACIPSFILWQSGENFQNIESLVKNDKPYKVGFAFNEKRYHYLKWKSISAKKPKIVLALGSSRILQLRQTWFDVPFYNAGFTVEQAKEYVPFLQTLPKEKLPQYLIINIDQWMLNENFVENWASKDLPNWTDTPATLPGTAAINKIWQGLFTGSYSFSNPPYQDYVQRVGLNAKIYNSGFRNDGSMDLGVQIQRLLANSSALEDS